ncbi:MAG TPA: amidohydrolase family protein, partial [Clostridia bacterium]|nr:amidohydrolase family protein [Clostridia bacterium]
MAHDNTLLIRGARLADSGPEATCDVLIRSGIIAAVKNAPRLEQKDSGERGLSSDGASIEAGGLTCLPAFCDMHAHFRDPGMTNKEDLASGSRAAVRGGYTAVNLMANTKPVISTHAQVKDVLARAKRIGLVDVHQCVSITRDMDGRTVDHLEGLGKHVRIISE